MVHDDGRNRLINPVQCNTPYMVWNAIEHGLLILLPRVFPYVGGLPPKPLLQLKPRLNIESQNHPVPSANPYPPAVPLYHASVQLSSCLADGMQISHNNLVIIPATASLQKLS